MLRGQLAWDLARSTGVVAYLLVTASVSLGLILSLQWRSPRWTRFISTELHEHLSSLGLVFLGAHTLSVALDPFVHFTAAEVMIPFASTYRPLWLAAGIVGTYGLGGVWASKRFRPRIGYLWWRRLHSATFLCFCLSTVHGLGVGTDTRTPWGGLLYAGAGVLVVSLLAARLLSPPASQRAHPWVALVAAGISCWILAWAVSGPLKPGWSLLANNNPWSSPNAVPVSAPPVSAPPTLSP